MCVCVSYFGCESVFVEHVLVGSSGRILAVCVCVCVCDPSQTEHASHSSRVAAVLAPCLVGLAIVAILGLALAAAKLRERRQTEGGFSPQQLQTPGGHNPPTELGETSFSTLAARVERLM